MYDLKRLQQIETQMMKAIHDVCQQLNIGYVMVSGTLLGAVRHQGFIPWDDDIDIGMTREDYETFLREGQKLLPANLFIQHYTTEKTTNNLFIKVRNTNTLFLENDNQNYDMNHGIFIDVFPFDRVPSSRLGAKMEYWKRKKFNIIAGCYSEEYIKTVQSSLKRKVGFWIHRHICGKRPIDAFFKREDERRKRQDRKGYDCYLLNQFTWDGTATHEELFGSQLYPFEQEQFWGPKDADTILTRYYGPRYMELPPEDKRITHEPLKVVFDLQQEKA